MHSLPLAKMEQPSEREIELRNAGLPEYQTKKFECSKECTYTFQITQVLLLLSALRSFSTEDLKALLIELNNAQQEQLVAEQTCGKLELMSTVNEIKADKEIEGEIDRNSELRFTFIDLQRNIAKRQEQCSELSLLVADAKGRI